MQKGGGVSSRIKKKRMGTLSKAHFLGIHLIPAFFVREGEGGGGRGRRLSQNSKEEGGAT